MAAAALLKFTQGGNVGNDGEALFVNASSSVSVANAVNTGVLSWKIEILEVPAGSSVSTGTLATNNSSSTPAATFTPDVSGTYRIRLSVWDLINQIGTATDLDIRNVGVKEAQGFLRPPSQLWPRPLPPVASGEAGNKPDENNFAGQTRGYVGSGSDGLLDNLIKTLGAAATTSTISLVELATAAETVTGTDTVRALTAVGLAALWKSAADVADNATITLGDGGSFNLITSTTAITAFTFTASSVGRTAIIRFNTARTLTHNATSLIIPGASNITTVAGDICQIEDRGSGNVRVNWYTPATVTGTGAMVKGTAPTLTGATMAGALAMGTNNVTAIKQANYTVNAGGNKTGAAPNLADWTAGDKQTITLTGNVTGTPTFTAPTGNYGSLILLITTGGFTMTWPTAVTWDNGVVPVLSTSGTDMAVFVYDGTTYRGSFWKGSTPVVETTMRVTSDVTNSTTSFADVTGMTAAVAANTNYRFRFVIYAFSATNTTGVIFALNGPSSPTALMAAGFMPQTVSATNNNFVTAYDTAFFASISYPGSSAVVVSTVEGIFRNGANAGTLALRVKSEIAASTVTVKTDSFGVITPF